MRKSASLLAAAALFASVLTAQAAPAQAATVSPAPITIDTTSQAAVQNAYQTIFLANANVSPGWTGSVNGCIAGTTTDPFRTAVINTVNYYRALAGLPSVVENATATTQGQQAALMMDAADNLSHTPGSSWPCYTANGYTGAFNGNLAWTSGAYTGTGVIPQWMSDEGTSSVGHRNAILYPPLGQVGVGQTTQAGVLVWMTDNLWTNTRVSGGISWPSPNFFPYENLPSSRYWSYSLQGHNFESTTVSVTLNGLPLSVLGYGERTNWHSGYIPDSHIVWQMPTLTAPAQGTTDIYHVTISGVGSYDVKVFSAATFIPSTITIGSVSITGSSAVGTTLTASVASVTPSDATVSYQWLRAGEPIAGATQSTYTLTAKDMCLQISVRVTASKSGYPNAIATSPSKTGPVFKDVPASHTFYSPICWVAQTGVTVGTGAGNYSPSDPVNRGSMAAFLYRMAGSPAWTPPTTSPFTDVPKTHKFYKEITWLAATGITVGVTIGGLPYYQPDNVVNRGSMSAFMYRLSGSPSYTAPATPTFADVAKSHTFYKTIAWLASKNITAGTMVNGQFVYQPSNAVSRGSMAAFLSRLSSQHLQCTTYPNGIQCGTG
ncbi:MAG: S-layer homology domain-containing protein [Propionibacteriaceae bacterium]|nr:S-layer homology domain-containing protein [Propionibacteriaceae bacterium]